MTLHKLYVFYFLAFSLFGQPLDQKTFSQVFQKVKDSVVSIKVSATTIVNGQPKTVEGGGSGSIVSSGGFIITNKHVVNDTTRSFKVILSGGEEVAASFVGMAPDTDLSLIKLTVLPIGGVKPIAFGDSDKIEVGNWVLVLGSPFGLGGTLTVGVISAKERLIPIPSDNGRIQPHSLIQTDASINPGNSGGALVNLSGEMVGVTTMNLSPTGASVGVGFAIPINVVKRVLEDIINKKTAVGWLGVLIQDFSELTPVIKKQLGILAQSGVIVTGLEFVGPAQKAGIKQYDTILEIDNQKVSNVTNFQWLERNLNPGKLVVLKIQRRNLPTVEEILVVVGESIKQKTGQK